MSEFYLVIFTLSYVLEQNVFLFRLGFCYKGPSLKAPQIPFGPLQNMILALFL